jgi:mono/diheme cytochrome c family protein/cytochrome c553
MSARIFSCFAVGTFGLFGLILTSRADDSAKPAKDPLTQFEREVRPILEERCFECHGPDKQKGGLRLDQKEGIFAGGDSGDPAVVPGKSAASALIKMVTSTDPDETMPPKGKRLAPEQIASIKRWIDDGAHWPQTHDANASATPSSEKEVVISDADRQFWAFQAPHRAAPRSGPPDPWERQPIDRFILARIREKGLEPAPEASREILLRRVTFDLTGLPPSPQELHDFLKDERPDAYEQVVARLLHSPRFGEHMASMWLPLARFAEDQAHQVGSDTKFFYPNAHLYRRWIINAFNRDLPYDQFLKLQLAADRMDCTDPGDLAALGFLGLGPKYYNRNRLEVMADEWEDRVDTVTRTMLGMTVACARCHDHKFDPITTADYYALAGVFASTRMVNLTPDGKPEKDGTKAEEMNPGTMHVVQDGDIQNLNIFIRGNVTRKGPVVPRRFLQVITPAEPAPFSDGSGRRELADAIANPANPLTARVFVNRVWGFLFGQPLVSTPSNFGHSGALPTHPILLDDLAARFVENGWSTQALVRELILSATYRQQSATDSARIARDPDNAAFARMNRRRLSIEQWRDAILAVTGELVETIGGKSQDLDDPANHARTVYARISRLKLNDLLLQFDYPDANVHAERRSVTTTPMQKLFVLNSAFMQQRANVLAARLEEAGATDEERIAGAYRLLFSREAESDEVTLALAFLQKPTASKMSRWTRYAQLLLASNEMLYVD